MSNCIIYIGDINDNHKKEVNKIYDNIKHTNIKLVWLHQNNIIKQENTDKYKLIQYNLDDLAVYDLSGFNNWAKLPELYLDKIGKFDKYTIVHYTTKYSGDYSYLIQLTNAVDYDLLTSNYKFYPKENGKWMWINEYNNRKTNKTDVKLSKFISTYNYLYCISYEALVFLKNYNVCDIKNGLDEFWLSTILYNYNFKCKSFNNLDGDEFNCNLDLVRKDTYGFGKSSNAKSIEDVIKKNGKHFIFSGYTHNVKNKNIILEITKLNNYSVINPKVSVIFHINKFIDLSDRLEELYNQTENNIEVIIVNENIDKYLNYISNYTNKLSILYINKQKTGFADSINVAINNASGKYCTIIQSDISIKQNYIEQIYKYVVNNICDIAYISINNNNNKYIYNITDKEIFDINYKFTPHASIFNTNLVKNMHIKFEEYYKDYYRKFSKNALNNNLIIRHISTDLLYSNTQKTLYISPDETYKIIKCYNFNKGNNLTCILTFRNERDEVEKTVQSIRATANGVQIILVNDNSENNYDYEKIAKTFDCKYIYHNKAIGCGPSRDDGVANCETPYFILLDSHMRFYDNNWDIRLVELIKQHPNSIICSQTSVMSRDKDGYYKNEDNSGGKSTSLGSIFNTDESHLFDVTWYSKQIDQTETGSLIKIYCVLGAGYCTSVEHWNNIYGLNGLYNYGLDEGLMSFKTWAIGGNCYLLKDFIIGHLYRSSSPFTNTNGILESNRLMCYDLFLEGTYKEQCIKKLQQRIGTATFNEAKKYYTEERKRNTLKLREKLLPKLHKNIFEFIELNNKCNT